MRALTIAATGMQAQQTERRGHLEQHREHEHDGLQAPARRVPGPALPEPRAAGLDLVGLRRHRAARASRSASACKPAAVYRMHRAGRHQPRPATPTISPSTAAAISRCSCRPAQTAYTRAGNFALSTPRAQIVTDGRLYRRAGHHRSAGRDRGHDQRRRHGRRRRIAGQTEPQTDRPARTRAASSTGRPEAIGDNLFLETAGLRRRADGGTRLAGLRHADAGLSSKPRTSTRCEEITALIMAQRAYEMNSKVITAADEMLQITSQMS